MGKVVKPKQMKKQGSKKSVKSDARLKALVDKINKEFGHNTVTLGVEELEKSYNQVYIPTGILQLDADLGGGVPVGRYIEVSGRESSTKTTLTLNIIGQAQRMGYLCSFVDIEGTSKNIDYLEACGVDHRNLIYDNPASLEEAARLVNYYQREGSIKVCGYDGIAASMVTEMEMDNKKQIGEPKQMGTPQKILQDMLLRFQMANNKFFRLGETPFTLISTNQIREKPTAYGDPEYTPGGRGKDFVSSVNIRLRQGDWIREGQSIVGQVVKYKISKNKLYKRMRAGEIDFYFDDNNAGVEPLHYDVMKDIVITAIGNNIIEQGGAWYSFGDVRVQGAKNMIEAVREDEDLQARIREEVMEIVSKTRVGK